MTGLDLMSGFKVAQLRGKEHPAPDLFSADCSGDEECSTGSARLLLFRATTLAQNVTRMGRKRRGRKRRKYSASAFVFRAHPRCFIITSESLDPSVLLLRNIFLPQEFIILPS